MRTLIPYNTIRYFGVIYLFYSLKQKSTAKTNVLAVLFSF